MKFKLVFYYFIYFFFRWIV